MLVGSEGSVRAVSLLFVTGTAVSLLTLAAEGRRPAPDVGLSTALVLWSIPGLVLGALTLRVAPAALIKALVAVGVLLAAAERLLPGRVRAFAVGPRSAGVLSGAFGSSTGLSGPPLVLHMLGTPRTPAVTRDTLAAVFLATDILGVPVLLAGGTFDAGRDWPWLLLAVMGGQLAGRMVFGRLSAAWFERLGLVVLIAAGLLTLGLLA